MRRRFVDKMAGEGYLSSRSTSSLSTPRYDYSQEAAYVPVRVLGKGAFGEATLYRKTEVGKDFNSFLRRLWAGLIQLA